MRNESAITVRFKVDFILLAILIVVIGCVVLSFHPFEVTSEDERGQALMPEQMGHGEVALVVPSTTTLADTFGALDFSFAWYNVLTQEVGPFSFLFPEMVTEQKLAGMRLIVVPRRAAAAMNETQIAAVETAVSRGASLLLEMPTPAWASLTAVKRKAQNSASIKRLTNAQNSPLPQTLKDSLLNFPLETQVLRIDALDNETLGHADMLLELDGAIAHYHRAHGAGHVFVLAFDLGEALTALQQGRPSDNFRIELDENADHAIPSDLVLSEKLKTNFIPYADILKRHVLASVWRIAPQVALWPFPNAERTLLLLTHDVAGIGDTAQYIVDAEKEAGAVSTFIASTEKTSSDWLSSLVETGSEAGTLIVRSPKGQLWRSIGPKFFAPVRKELNAASQRNIISNRARRNVTTCRMHGLNWQPDYTSSFRILRSAKCQIDLSYGPSDGMLGYLFGTGFPFLPLDRGGVPFPVYEIPTLLSDAVPSPVEPASALKILRESAELYHEPVVFNFSADTMREHPHYQAVEAWLQSMEYASKEHIRFSTVQKYMQYFSIRKQAVIQSTFQEQTHTLDAHIELPDYEDVYTLSIPTRTMYGGISSLVVDQKQVDAKVLTTVNGGTLTLLPLVSGSHRVVVQYD